MNESRGRALVIGAAAVVGGMLVGALVVAAAGRNPLEFFRVYFVTAFSDIGAWSRTLRHVTPVLLTGLSIALAYRGGLFNVGAEGQLVAGGLAAAALGIYVPLPSVWIHVPLVLAGGCVAGALIAWPPAWLRVRRGVHEVVTTIMINYAMLHAAAYLVNGPMNAGRGSAFTFDIAWSARMPTIVGVEGQRGAISLALPIAAALAVMVAYTIRRTRFGYEMRAVGGNLEAARLAGIRVDRIRVRTMLLAGAISGLAGALLVSADYHNLRAGFSAGYGFDGIAVAFLAACQAPAVPLTALLFGSLRAAGVGFDFVLGLSQHLITILQAAIIFAVGARSFLARMLPRRQVPRAEASHD